MSDVEGDGSQYATSSVGIGGDAEIDAPYSTVSTDETKIYPFPTFRSWVQNIDELYWTSKPVQWPLSDGYPPTLLNGHSSYSISQPATEHVPDHPTLPVYPRLPHTPLLDHTRSSSYGSPHVFDKSTDYTSPGPASRANGRLKRKREAFIPGFVAGMATEGENFLMLDPRQLETGASTTETASGDETPPSTLLPAFMPRRVQGAPTSPPISPPPIPANTLPSQAGATPFPDPSSSGQRPALGPHSSRRYPFRDVMVLQHCKDSLRRHGISETMLQYWRNPNFLRTVTVESEVDRCHANPEAIARQFHFMLEEEGPDIFFIMSVRGMLEYVSPNVLKNLGFKSETLIGSKLQNFLHPGDAKVITDLLRGSKETSPGKTIRVLVRALTPPGPYVLLDWSGRFVAQANQTRRTTFVASARCQEMPILRWGMIAMGDGIVPRQKAFDSGDENGVQAQDFWMSISHQSLVILSVSEGVQGALGWSPEAWTGQHLRHLLLDGDDIISDISEDLCACGPHVGHAKMFTGRCTMKVKTGYPRSIVLNAFRPQRDPEIVASTMPPGCIPRAPLLLHVRLEDAKAYSLIPSFSGEMAQMLGDDIFQALHQRDSRSLDTVVKDLVAENWELGEMLLANCSPQVPDAKLC
ncbi:hypothetical protein BKA70DRAFT_1443448 [Coprinopsis sp. MPI-PUGE-AT-0042]|nr:hypothetical protein BKA70DRAFT_1443448 [Coprinopsis sp. MPI-PUGE-AT-0042]